MKNRAEGAPSSPAADWSSAGALVRRMIARDPGADEEFVSRYQRGVRTIVSRASRDSSVVDDLSQDVLRIAIEKVRAGAVREPDRLSGFVAGLARTRVLDHFRRVDARTAADVRVHAETPVAPSSPLDRVLERERAEIVREVINDLGSERDRQILLRYYLAEEDKGDICRDLGLTPSQFDTVLFRARERTRARLMTRAAGLGTT